MHPYWQSADNGIMLYHTSASALLAELADGAANALVTDPPYGLGELSGTITKGRARNAYGSALFDDTEQYVCDVVVPCIKLGLQKCGGRGLITTGVRCMFGYPRPRAVGGFYQPAAVGMSPWGFAGFSPVLFYGKDPRDGKGQSNVMTTLVEAADPSNHPCPKPLKAMLWMVNKATLPGETVLDLFCGTGTTAQACVRLARRFIGCDVECEWLDEAIAKLEREQSQGDFVRDIIVAQPDQTVLL